MQLVTVNNRDLQLFQTNYLSEIFLWIGPQDQDQLFVVLQKVINDEKVIDQAINNLIHVVIEHQMHDLSELRDYITCKIKLHSFYSQDPSAEQFGCSFFSQQYLREYREEKIKNSLDYFLDSYNDEKYPFVKEFVEKCKQARLSDV